MKQLLLVLGIIITSQLGAQLKTVPLIPESFARVFSGPVTVTDDGLKINTVGRRNGNMVMLKDGVNIIGQEIYVRWYLKSSSYIRGSIHLSQTIVNSGSLDTYPKNEWMYTRIRVNADYTFSITTARNNYDNQGGTLVNNVTGTVPESERPMLLNTNIAMEIADTYDTEAYLTIAELKVPEDVTFQYQQINLWDFETGLPPEISFTGTGTCSQTETDAYTGSGSLKMVANSGDILQFDIPEEVDFMTFRFKIDHAVTKWAPVLINEVPRFLLSIYANGSTSYAPEWCEVALPIVGNGSTTNLKIAFGNNHLNQVVLIDDVRFYQKNLPKSQLSLDNAVTVERSPAGTTIGTFAISESTGRDVQITNPPLPGNDNSSFQVDGLLLKNAETLYYDLKPVYHIDLITGIEGVLPLLYNNMEVTLSALEFAGGDGSASTPYQIENPRHLNNIRNYLGYDHSDKHFELINDIDMTEALSATGTYYNEGAFWEPIGTAGDYFESKLNGNGYSITNFKINRPLEDVVGLFTAIGNGGDIQNLKVITDGETGVKGRNVVGILSGYVEMSSTHIFLKNILVAGLVNGNDYVGGMAGQVMMGRSIEDCSVNAHVYGNNYVGGLFGYNSNNNHRCYTWGTVTGSSYVGGLIGFNMKDYEFWMEDGQVHNSYSTSNVTGTSNVGGFIGYNAGVVNRCHSTGSVSGTENTGGLIGGGSNENVSDCYWNTETSGQTASLGGQGLTTEMMRDESSFSEWDFSNVWTTLSDNYRSFPFLRSVATELVPGKIGVPTVTTLPDVSPILYGQKIGDAVVNNNGVVEHEGIEIDGSYVLSSTDLKPLVGNETVDFVFLPTQSELYLSVSGQLQVQVNPAPLTVSANDQSRTYGAANPDFTLSYSGFVNGEDASAITPPVAATTADATSSVGDYAITLSGASADNYALTLVEGKLSVTPAPLTVTALDQTRKMGEPNPLFELEYSGFVNGEDASVLIQEPLATTAADELSGIGEYSIDVAGGEAANYFFIYQSGTLFVTTSVGITPSEAQPKITVYPNPFSSVVVFTGFDGEMTKNGVLYDLTGRAIRTFTVTDGVALNLSDLSSGLYLIRIDHQLFKLIKE